jgi:phage terminase small subunit
MNKLTQFQRAFVNEYLKDHSMKEAAIRAGSKSKTPDRVGHEIFHLPHVKAEIERRIRKLEDEVDFRLVDVLRLLWKVGNADIRKAFDENGRLRAVQELPDDIAMAIASLDEDELFEGAGREREQVGVTKKVKLKDSVRALELLGRYFKAFTDKVEHSVDENLWNLLEGLDERIDKAQGK